MTQALPPRGKSTRLGRKPVEDNIEIPIATPPSAAAFPRTRLVRQEQRPATFGGYVVQPKQ